MTDDGKLHKLVYDALGRLVEVLDRTSNTLKKHYRYDGLGQRVAERFASGGISDTTPWACFVYDDRWRIVKVDRQASTTSSSLTSAATLADARPRVVPRYNRAFVSLCHPEIIMNASDP